MLIPSAIQQTSLVQLLIEAFPDGGALPEDCWAFDAIEANQWDFGPEIDIVTANAGRPYLIDRLRNEHPSNRAHREEHDDRLLDVFTEVQAFAWAHSIARLGVPHFVAAAGSPDVRVGDWWIEAKCVNRSAAAQEQARRERPLLKRDGIILRQAVAAQDPPSGLFKKFDSQLANSIKKWERQGRTGTLVTFFNLALIDYGISRQGVRNAIPIWAAYMERRHQTKIVICENWKWETPLYSQDFDALA